MSESSSSSPSSSGVSPTLRVLWDGFRGAFVAFVEVTVFGQPMVYAKNMLQQKRPLAGNLLHWYRGYGLNAGSILPITALQMATSTALLRAYTGPRKATQGEETAFAFASGLLCAVVAGPAELVILHQQQQGTSLVEAARGIVQRRGSAWAFRRGMLPCGLRDGLFCLGYISGAPAMQHAAEKATGSKAAGIAASIAVGAAAGLLSHPIDTTKTRMQDPDAANWNAGMMRTMRNVYSKEGLSALFNGAMPRTARIVFSVVVYSNLNMWLDRKFGPDTW